MPKQVETPQIFASRRGNAYTFYVNDKTGSGSTQVLTDAGLVLNLADGDQALVTSMHFDLTTVSDSCHFNLVTTNAADGAGDANEVCGHVHLVQGAALANIASKERPFDPPLCFKYSDGVRSITMRINTNDNAAVVSCGFNCWIEKEL